MPEPPARDEYCRIILPWNRLNVGDDRDRSGYFAEFAAKFSASDAM